MLLGYARVSTTDQDPQLQLDALTAADCQRIYTDHASGAATGRPELDRLLDTARSDDTIVVWRLDGSAGPCATCWTWPATSRRVG